MWLCCKRVLVVDVYVCVRSERRMFIKNACTSLFLCFFPSFSGIIRRCAWLNRSNRPQVDSIVCGPHDVYAYMRQSCALFLDLPAGSIAKGEQTQNESVS